MENKEAAIEFKIEQHSVLNDFEIVLSMGVGIDEVHHTEDLVGKGTRLSPLGLSEEILHNIHDVENKLDKVDTPNVVYGTDNSGEQTTYDKNSFGKVDDVLVDEVSVVENKIAHINLTGKVDKTDEASKIYGTDENGDQTTYDKEDFGKVDDVQLNGTSVVVDKIANIEPEAGDVAYTNSQYPAIHTLQDAMDELLYITPSVTLRGGGTTYEEGRSISSVSLTWTWNKTIQSQSLNQGIGSLDPAVRAYTYETPITTNTTFTITGSDGKNSANSSTSISFKKVKYWGESAKDTLEDTDIRALRSHDWYNGMGLASTSFDCTPTVAEPDGFYIYYAVPATVSTDPTFYLNGQPNTAYLKTVKSDYVNAYGKTMTYTIYRFMKLNKLTAKYTLEVK